MANDKIFNPCTRQCVTVIEPNNNSFDILKLRVFDAIQSANIILQAIESIDTGAITGSVDINLVLSALESVDAIQADAEAIISAYLLGSESIDTILIEARAILSAALSGIDAGDSAEIGTDVIISAELDADDIVDAAHIIASSAGDRSAILAGTEPSDTSAISIRHADQPQRNRTFIPLSRVENIIRKYQRYAVVDIKENRDGVNIIMTADAVQSVAAFENRDGIKIGVQIINDYAVIAREKTDGITNDAEEFHRVVEAQNLKYEQAEIELLAMVA